MYASCFNRETGAGFHTDGKLLVALFVVNTQQLKVINTIVVLVARLWLMFILLQDEDLKVLKSPLIHQKNLSKNVFI